MCPYCSTRTPIHQTGPPDLRPLSVLRLTDTEWIQYRKDSGRGDTYKLFDREGWPKIRVVGFNDDTKSVLGACEPVGEEYIEVNWSVMDSLLFIGQRIEDQIHVALHHWVLATSDGVVFKSFGELVGQSSAFKTNEKIVLTLLVPSDLPEFLNSHMKEHTWNRLTPETTTSSNPLKKAKAEFHLIDPEASPNWKAYLDQRHKDNERVAEGLEDYMGEDLPFMYEKIEQAVDDVLLCTDLSEDERQKMHDCVVPLLPDVQDDGWGNVRSAGVLSRIYSAARPAAVDVYMRYHYRTRYESVEFFCNVYYRAHASVAKELKSSVPQSKKKLNGFKSLLEMGLKDLPPGRRWRAIEERSFDIDQAQVVGLHHILFGSQAAKRQGVEEGGEKHLSEKFGKADMLELMLAAVGVAFTTAREEEDDDGYDMGEMTWEGLQGSERWLGRNIRRVCGIEPMVGDDKDSEDEGAQDEDEDEDEDEDSEWEDEP
ncbi:hypothetical protein DXG01_005489 [Tephrocybe rancida]|nr:hypothetical protein DXG01_005489 [Tephrocybe rancida]